MHYLLFSYRGRPTGLAIREVNARRRVIDPELAAAISDGISPLTGRPRLFLSEGTVRNYLSAATRKLGARNRTEAVRIAEDKGWL